MIPALAPQLGTMSPAAIAKVNALAAECLRAPQVEIPTTHTLHAGMYARTIRIPAGVLLTGTLLRVPTLLIFSGDALIYTGADTPLSLRGYHVLRGEMGRKQVFLARADTDLTMVFPTQAKTITEAEDECTSEAHLLMSRKPGALNLITHDPEYQS